MPVRVLLLSAYDADSHARWRTELEQQFPDWQWTQLSLPPRYFSWRLRGNSLSWAWNERAILTADYDLLLATGMTDLSALRGFVPSLARLPTIVYFHENQFAYPVSDKQHNVQVNPVEPRILNLYTALCADQLVFNSCFNRDSFMAGAQELLAQLPDHVPDGLLEQLTARAQVLPVPLADQLFRPSAVKDSQPLTLVWNHRWEYDKAPERLLAALRHYVVSPDAQPLRVHVVGQRFRQQPLVMAELRSFLSEQGALGEWGYVEDSACYRQLLSESHLAVSTALHDFQGLSVLEAVAAGCRPLVPERQAYPEWFGAGACYLSDLENPEREAEALAQGLLVFARQHRDGVMPPAPDIRTMAWSSRVAEYRQLFFAH